MAKKTVFLFNFLLVCVAFSVDAQELKLGKVSQDDFRLSEKNKDSAAAAIILDRNRETHFEYSESDGWFIVSQVQERILILKKEGLEYATKTVGAYKNENDEEEVSKIKGYTHTLNGNSVDTEKLKNEAIFDREKSEHWDAYSWTMPNVSPGSIVEWEYTITSPFWKIDDLEIQDDIPTLHYGALIRFPSIFSFNRLKKGYFDITPQTVFKKAMMGVSVGANSGYGGRSNINSKQGTLNYTEQQDTYSINDIPALKKEIFVNNPDNYRYTVVYELGSVRHNNGTVKKYSTSWDEVSKSIFDNERFGKQLEKTIFLQNEAKIIKSAAASQEELVNKAFEFIRDSYSWNGNFGKYVVDDLDEVWKRHTGNVAEINLMLIALLRTCGIDANPVLISTQEHGIPMFPTIEGFNYVIAGVGEGDDLLLLDATEKISAPGMLPSRVFNWEGRLVKKNGTSMAVDLYPKNQAKTDEMITFAIAQDGILKGTVQRRYSSSHAMAYRKKNNGRSKDENLIAISRECGTDEITDLETKYFDQYESPVVESFTFDLSNGYDQVGNKIFISPLLFLHMSSNPFKEEERVYPINFDYPFTINKIVSMQLPEGYSIEYLPESINAALPDNMGSFSYNIADNGKSLSLNVSFKINRTVFPVEAYGALKKLYDQRLVKENEKVVLLKNENEYKSPARGR